jgi:hypothetical protein
MTYQWPVFVSDSVVQEFDVIGGNHEGARTAPPSGWVLAGAVSGHASMRLSGDHSNKTSLR